MGYTSYTGPGRNNKDRGVRWGTHFGICWLDRLVFSMRRDMEYDRGLRTVESIEARRVYPSIMVDLILAVFATAS